MVKVTRVSASRAQLLEPGAPEWGAVGAVELQLQPTPLSSQPSVYVLSTWKERPYGAVRSVRVQAAHNRESISFRLSWSDDAPVTEITDTDVFTDAAAVLFPLRGGDAPLTSMGSPKEPVLAWYWRADFDAPLSITAQGIGSSVRHPDGALLSQASHSEGAWSVVVSRLMGSHLSDTVHLMPGRQSKVAFAVWQGANRERGGLKAVTLEWQPLEIED